MWFDSDQQYGDNMERSAFDDLGRVMVWLCLVGFWMAVVYWVLA
jgi:hypothetical protein